MILGLQEAVSRILGGGGASHSGGGKLPVWDLGTEVNHITLHVDPVIVNLDDVIVLCVLFILRRSASGEGVRNRCARRQKSG